MVSANPDELSKNSRIMNWTHMSPLGSCANSLKISKIEKIISEIHPMTVQQDLYNSKGNPGNV